MKKILAGIALFVAGFLLVSCGSSKDYKLPDLKDKSKAEITEIFKEINEEIIVRFEYQISSKVEKDYFVSYKEEGLKKGVKVSLSKTINIIISKGAFSLPDLSGFKENKIIEEFENNNFLYDLEIKINIIRVFDAENADGTFLMYGNDLETGFGVSSNEEFDIYVSFKTMELPDLTGLKVSDMEAYFENLGIPAEKIEYRIKPGANVAPATFIGYDGYEVGNIYDFSSSGKLRVFYDPAILLPDITGYNKREILDLFDRHSMREKVTFVETVDDNYEYDTFASYGGGLKIGDPVVKEEISQLVINIYINTDVNIEDRIMVEYDLFISKYIDSSFGQGIELYNGSPFEVDLSDYYIAILGGAEYRPTQTISLSTNLAPGETYVIVGSGSDQELKDLANLISSEMYFNPSDNIQLRRVKNDTYTDSIYSVGNISSLMNGEIFVRRSNFTHGRRDYVYREWMGFVPDKLDIIGTHPVISPVDPVFELIEDRTFQEYGMTKVRFIRAADGDTVYFESLDPRDTANYNGDGRVRFLLVNTPEIGEPYKLVAENFTKNLLENASEIYIQSSKEAGLTETYGRHLGLVWANIGTVENPNWKLVNYELLKNGLGKMMIAKSGKFYDHPIFGGRYLYQWAEDADEHAEKNNLGLYSGVHAN